MSSVNRFSESNSSLASPWCVLATYAVDTEIKWAPEPVAAMAAPTREGPRRLISTAWVSGASKETVAAEWMTMSLAARAARPASSSPSPSCPTSPGTALTRRATSAAKPSPSSSRRRLKQSFLMISLARRAAASVRRPGRTSTVISASGMQRRMRSTRAVPKNPVAPVMKMRFARRSRPIGTRTV